MSGYKEVLGLKIAVVSETSSGDKNKDVMAALQGFGHEIINVGMKDKSVIPELTYIETGLLSAILLNAGIVDFVVGGCGSGQGYMNSVLQYPDVVCGLILNPIDAYLFRRINGGNCISLSLNIGYGAAGDLNLKYIFEKLFVTEPGAGHPAHRAESQRSSRAKLIKITRQTHMPFAEIIRRIEPSILNDVLSFPGVWELIEKHQFTDMELRKALESARKR